MNKLPEPHYFWKNFRLGAELHIAGTYIFNAVDVLDKMESFYNEDECFEFLYNVSIGLERLQKIIIVMSEHNEESCQEDFERSLITHNHLELLKRVTRNHELKIGKQHNRFLAMLDKFYKTARYGKYTLSSVYKPSQERKLLVDFVSQELKVEIKVEGFFVSPVTHQMRSFLIGLIKKLTTQLYDIVRNEAVKLGIFTYEIRYGSKAFKIFIAEEFSFEKEKLMQREVFLHLIKKFPEGELKKFVDEIDPLEFGVYKVNYYIESMLDSRKRSSVVDEMITIYEDENKGKERFEKIMILGSQADFDDDSCFLEEEE